MPSLADVQRALRRSLVGGDAAAAAFIVADGIAAADRLAIHRHTFASVTTRALRLHYPAVEKLVGAACFDAAARAHVAARPPVSAWLDRYGGGFGGFLAHWPPVAALAYLGDVARLEWAVSRVLHARDVPAPAAGALAALAALDRHAQAEVRFTHRPCLRMLCTRTAADAIWRATLGGDDDALATLDPLDGPRWLLVERAPAGVDVVALSEPQWRFTRDLCAGRSVEQALARAAAFSAAADRASGRPPRQATQADRFDPAGLLGAHLAAGRFTAFTVAAPRKARAAGVRSAGRRDPGVPAASLEEATR